MIYLVGKDFDSPFKIGRSDDPERRVKDIQTYTYFPVRLIGEICFEDYNTDEPDDIKAEKAIHRSFAAYRLQGEWFKCSQQQFQECLDQCEFFAWLEPVYDDDSVWVMLEATE